MTATDIITALSNDPYWWKEAALLIYPRKRGKNGHYETTQSRVYTEVTVRVATVKTAKRTGRQYDGLQRRRIDLVAVIQANKYKWQPIIAGVEVKVAEHDLMNDNKMADYLPYCDLFYIAVPPCLIDLAHEKALQVNSRIGVMLIDPTKKCYPFQQVHVERIPIPMGPDDTHLKEIYAELLIKPFRSDQ